MIFKKTPVDKKYDAAGDDEDGLSSEKYPPLGNFNTVRQQGGCFGCGAIRKISSYPIVHPKSGWGLMDKNGKKHFVFCENCFAKLIDQYTEEAHGNKYKALYRMCMYTGYYYDDKLAHRVIEEEHKYDDNTPVPKSYHWGLLYNKAVREDLILSDKTFYDSDNIMFEEVVKYHNQHSVEDLMSDEDKNNRITILSVFHCDPFEDEELLDRVKLQNDLVTMIDDSMADDMVRQKAAIEIVRSFHRIDKISKALQELQTDKDTMLEHTREIKELSETKQKETSLVTQFSKDHGFAEKYATAKSRGSGSLGYIIKEMNEKGYDRGAVNKFDIDTAEAMKQVADISSSSMAKQVALSDSDKAVMIKDQSIIINRMRETMEKQAEELRLLREKHLKSELLDEYKKDLKDKGLNEEQIDRAVKEELDRRIPVV